MKVIELCGEHNIEFVCLPPNATDKLQPLDVGLFAPMKSSWKKQLHKYKEEDPNAKLLYKTEFPRMLLELYGNLNPENHLPKAFEKCGLYPLDPAKAMARIPSVESTKEIASHVDMELMKKLEVRRFQQKKKPRGNKIPSGTSYSEVREESEEGVSGMNLNTSFDSEHNDGEETDLTDKETDNEVPDSPGAVSTTSNEEDEPELPDPEAYNPNIQATVAPVRKQSESWIVKGMGKGKGCGGDSRPLVRGSLVVAVYEGQWFIAEVSSNQKDVSSGHKRLSYMGIKGMNTFAWEKEDIFDTPEEDILFSIKNTIIKNSRGYIGLNKEDLTKVEKHMKNLK